jgi:hypothetical protein
MEAAIRFENDFDVPSGKARHPAFSGGTRIAAFR